VAAFFEGSPMAVSAIRKAPLKAPLAALLMLGCSVIAVPAQAGWFDLDSKPAAKTDTKVAVKAKEKEAVQPATTLEDSIQQAQMLRLAGNYPDAIKHLSQVMMVASDDSRVISEYGKTLAAMGRASDAVNFLTRAQQLQPGDWTVYSALGVAYDQIGDQKTAQVNYERALAIKPEEPSVLNNYALSRMLAKDPEMARNLAARAESAGGKSDSMIGRNIAMIRSLVPETVSAPAQQAHVAHATVPAPAPVASSAAPHVPAPVAINVQPQIVASPVRQSENRVVMQKVPVDPLAGPVAAKPAGVTPVAIATSSPRPLQTKTVASTVETAPAPVKPAAPTAVATAKVTPAAPVKAAEVKPAPVLPAVATAKVMTPAPVKAVEAKPVPVTAAVAAVKATPSTPVKAAEAKPAPVTAAIATAKLTPATPVKAAEVKPVPVAAAVATAKLTPATPVKAAEVKPVKTEIAPVATAKTAAPVPVKAAEAAKPAPSVSLKMTAPAPVKTAEADKAAPKVLVAVKMTETKPVPVKAVVKTKDAIPGLRLSANAY
jgi:Flp pilus assembly protein TadD